MFVINREKKLLVGSEDYGRDLTGVQNLRKKHKRLEAELSSHEPTIQVGHLYSLVVLFWPVWKYEFQKEINSFQLC